VISRAQQILLKRAQREASLSDLEYRDALELISGCRSSKDDLMTDRHMDVALAYFEAICWRKVDAGELPQPCSSNAVFRQRHYWANKNPRGETSRDRYNGSSIAQEVSRLESEIEELGCGPNYCAAIRARVTHGRNDDFYLHLYKAALQRTLTAKQRPRVQGGR
jgi:hypothetical protein